ncbi:MAG: protein kinase, partial [Myxococcales bacterium]|nr:protein kinase [Myxococcales bacterium]
WAAAPVQQRERFDVVRSEEVLREFGDGQVVPGTRYRVLRLIGAGGMGCVYDVEHTELGKRFVLKSLLRELASREDLVARLRNEWRALAKLEHPNIVSVTDAGTSSSGVPFYVMERLEGETLAARVKREGRIHPAEAARIAAEILEGLTAAHEIGIVHRDVKPPNIFLLRDGSVKLLDFGIAKVHSSAMNITGRGVAVGTPRYMSPEQARGDRVDGRADLYAVGLILFEMLAGAGPFDKLGEGNDLLLAHLTRTPPQVSQLANWVPMILDSLVAALLSKDPRQRPASARGAAQELRRFLAAPIPTPVMSPVGADSQLMKETAKATPAQLGTPTARDGLAAGSMSFHEPVSSQVPSWATRGEPTHVDSAPSPAPDPMGQSHHTRPEAPAFSERPNSSVGGGTAPLEGVLGNQPWIRTQRLDELTNNDTAVPPTRTAVNAFGPAVAMGTPPPAENTVVPAPRSPSRWIAVGVGVLGLLGAIGLVAWQLVGHTSAAVEPVTSVAAPVEEPSPAGDVASAAPLEASPVSSAQTDAGTAAPQPSAALAPAARTRSEPTQGKVKTPPSASASAPNPVPTEPVQRNPGGLPGSGL